MDHCVQDRSISPKTVVRLSVYRRALLCLDPDTDFIFSHDLAQACGSSAAQVRRDLMAIGSSGSPSRGYAVRELIEHIDHFFACMSDHKVAMVGAGSLGRSLMTYFQRRYLRLSITAVFDRDPRLTGRVIHGIRSYPMEELGEVVRTEGITLAVLALPDASAQEVAEQLVEAGVSGILNFAAVSLRLPESTCVENIDITAALDKLAYFSFSKRTEQWPIQER